MHAHTTTHTYTYTHTHTHAISLSLSPSHTHTRIHTHIHAHTHTYTHTHTHNWQRGWEWDVDIGELDNVLLGQSCVTQTHVDLKGCWYNRRRSIACAGQRTIKNIGRFADLITNTELQEAIVAFFD